jgi:hypothetical protein
VADALEIETDVSLVGVPDGVVVVVVVVVVVAWPPVYSSTSIKPTYSPLVYGANKVNFQFCATCPPGTLYVFTVGFGHSMSEVAGHPPSITLFSERTGVSPSTPKVKLCSSRLQLLYSFWP